MRFQADTYAQELHRLVAELLDEATAAAWGDEAGLWTCLALGIADGDIVEVDAKGYVILQSGPAEIDRLIASARAARAAGKTFAQWYEEEN